MSAMPLYGLVLAGGQSARMGRDKGALVYHDCDQTHALASLLAPYVEDVFVSVRETQLSAAHLAGLRTIVDHYTAPTPLNGIVSAMRHRPGASWLVVAVDMPHINGAAIETLIASRHADTVATCFESPVKGGSDPLFAIWEGHGFAALEERIASVQEHVCPRSTLKDMNTHIIKNAVAPKILDNINTPEEWAALQRQSA